VGEADHLSPRRAQIRAIVQAGQCLDRPGAPEGKPAARLLVNPSQHRRDPRHLAHGAGRLEGAGRRQQTPRSVHDEHIRRGRAALHLHDALADDLPVVLSAQHPDVLAGDRVADGDRDRQHPEL
jgi:hypothetical protein